MDLQKEIDNVIKNAFREDIGEGDITTLATVPVDQPGEAQFFIKADGIIAGVEVAKRVFELFDPTLECEMYVKDGQQVKKGDIAGIVRGKAASILTTERTALNLLQRMSGIATYASVFAKAVSDTNAKIIDTRKTVPGLRLLDKMAVAAGGCGNHRIGLYDMFLIKDNHITASGSIASAVENCRRYMQQNGRTYRIEVEVSNLQQTQEAIYSKADVIMLDNFEIESMKQAVALIAGRAQTEASGGVTLESVRAIAMTGVDLISIGALTHSVKALDISLKLKFNHAQ